MADNFIMLDLNDEKSKHISEILGNNTCKKIINYLAEVKEASEKDLSDKLNIPINTVEYNLNKLVKAGLVEKTKNFFWSVKGKKIDMYRLSNKKILISPKSSFRGIVPAFLSVLIGSFIIKLITNNIDNSNSLVYSTERVQDSIALANEKAVGIAGTAAPVMQKVSNFSNLGEVWLWFLLGGLFVILVFLVYDQIKQRMKGG